MIISRATEKDCGLIVVDLQEKFVPMIPDWDSLVARSLRLIRFFQLIQGPIVVTEQYPKGLGSTVSEVRKALAAGKSETLSKTSFSSCGTPGLMQRLEANSRRQWIICGIEAHVCIQQTVFDLIDLGNTVFLPVDALGSRHPIDRQTGLDRMAKAGAILSSSESLMFEILRDAKHPLFKQAVALVK